MIRYKLIRKEGANLNHHTIISASEGFEKSEPEWEFSDFSVIDLWLERLDAYTGRKSLETLRHRSRYCALGELADSLMAQFGQDFPFVWRKYEKKQHLKSYHHDLFWQSELPIRIQGRLGLGLAVLPPAGTSRKFRQNPTTLAQAIMAISHLGEDYRPVIELVKEHKNKLPLAAKEYAEIDTQELVRIGPI